MPKRFTNAVRIQGGCVLPPLTQRRHAQRNRTQSVEHVFSQHISLPHIGQTPTGDVYRAALLGLVAQVLDGGQIISPHPTANNNAYKMICYREGFPARLDRAALQKEVTEWQQLGFARIGYYRRPNRQSGQCLELSDLAKDMINRQSKASISYFNEEDF